MFAVFNIAIFTGAFLIFLIQPMIANILLPKVGGSPNIWNTSAVFFQVSLLAGYFYSYIVSQKLSLKRQIVMHCCLLFCALWTVDFHFQSEQISVASPVCDVLRALLKNIFFPFVLLSTTSPLVQRWLSLSDLKESKNPYMLYVCSNIGSLSALYAYPLGFEKVLTVSEQSGLWRILFAAFFAMIAVLGVYLIKTAVPLFAAERTERKPAEKTSPVLIFYWIFFAFVPSSLMLGVTSHLSTDIGGLPFLWIFPLSLYLLSFVFTFSRFYTEKTSEQFLRLYKTAALVAVFLFFSATTTSNIKQNAVLTGTHCLLYLIFAIYCHGVLSAKKPDSEKLTLFYLCLAIGGALGGVFNTFIAPHLFLFVWEYPFVIALSLPFVLIGASEQKTDFVKAVKNEIILFFVAAVSINLHPNKSSLSAVIPLFAVLAVSVLVFSFSKRKQFFVLCLFVFAFLPLFFEQSPDIVFKKRNFFGTILVEQKTLAPAPFAFLKLFHGDTLHGRQNLFVIKGETFYDFNPSTYYGKHAAVKDFFDVYDKPAPVAAWLGLGSGAIICYAPQNTKHDVFEIDKDMVDISLKYRYFRYLEHCAPHAAVKIGDARMEIAKEQNHKYDLITFDAFSSHFIPVHLTTKEAIETYRSKLKPDGVILLHISSRAFDVEPVLTRIARELGMTFIVRNLPKKDYGGYPQWGVLSNSPDAPEIKALLAMPGWRKGEMKENTPLWTDDFHNLLSALRR